MSQNKLHGAFVAWSHAIGYALTARPQIALEALAEQFGRRITDEEHLNIVRQWFNFGEIDKSFNEVPQAAKSFWRVARTTHTDDPNEVWQVIVTASSPQQAREVAAEHCGNEGPDAWRNPQRTHCIQLDDQAVVRQYISCK